MPWAPRTPEAQGSDTNLERAPAPYEGHALDERHLYFASRRITFDESWLPLTAGEEDPDQDRREPQPGGHVEGVAGRREQEDEFL